MNKLTRLFRYEWPLHLVLMLTNWLPDNVIFMRMRGFLIRPFFKKCGRNLRVGRSNTFYCAYNMVVGDDVYIASGNWFESSVSIFIDNEVMFGPQSLIVTSNHSRMNGSFRYGANISAPIHIGFGAWIGGNCAILSGAEIGKGSVIGANSTVRSKVPDNCLFAGNPGQVIKEITD